MTDPSIRRATVADAERLAAVYRSAYLENRDLGFPAKAGSVTAEDVSSWIRNDRVYVAERDGELVGGVRVERTATDRAKLSRFSVHGAHEREGVGTALLEHAEERAREEGCTTTWLTTPGEHPYLPDLYRRRGYEETGEYPLEDREYDEIVMEKELR